jgi:5'-nucleotidase
MRNLPRHVRFSILRLAPIAAFTLFAAAGCNSDVSPLIPSANRDGGAAVADGGGVIADGGGAAPDGGSADAGAARTVELQILSISDWHGQLDPLSVSGSEIGGAGVLSAYFKRDRAANPNTLVLTAGDAYGASPPISAAFEEEPAVKALNLMGLAADTFGNHNFDLGVSHLQRMINLATYKSVSSNLLNLESNLTGVVTPFHIVTIDGVKVGIIGITNPDAASLLFPGRMGTIQVFDPAASAMAAAASARTAGAKVIVALVHMGATGSVPDAGATGPLLDFARATAGLDVILGDHTDVSVNQVVNGQLVVENRSKGLTYARVKVTVNTATGVTAKSAEILTPTKSSPFDGGVNVVMAPDPAVEDMLTPYRTQLAGRFDNVIGVAANVFARGSNVERLGEVPIGNLIADAIRARYGTQIAFTNGGGIRAPLPSSYAPANHALRRTTSGYAAGPPYDLVTGDIYAVLPFGNAVVTRTITGEKLWAALEHSVSSLPGANGKFLQISGFKFTYQLAADGGMRVRSVTLDNNTAIARDGTTYTLALPDFTNSGGDGYTMLVDGTGATREIMADVVHEYIKTQATITPTTNGRIVAVP